MCRREVLSLMNAQERSVEPPGCAGEKCSVKDVDAACLHWHEKVKVIDDDDDADDGYHVNKGMCSRKLVQT